MVGEALIRLAPALPLAAALLALTSRGAVWARALGPWAAVPMLLAPLFDAHVKMAGPLLGLELGVDDTSAPLLLLAGLLWFAAGAYAAGQFGTGGTARSYWFFHHATLGTNAAVLLSQDLLGLYLAYSLMALSVYGLVVHDRERLSVRAGRIYIVLALAADGVLLAALFVLGAALGNAPLAEVASAMADHPHGGLLVAVSFAAFAVKMGTVPSHVWLPLAHPRAPIPASAVLSGVIVKAGLVGWLRLMPLGEAEYRLLGESIAALGLVSAFAGAALGLFQRDAKAVLAYSTVSQMGLVTVLVGAGLAVPSAWGVLLPAALLFALHHGLAKGALFLGVGVETSWRRWLLVLPAAALAGVPFSTGALAKTAGKQALEALPGAFGTGLAEALSLSSLVTGLLLLRFLWLIGEPGDGARPGLRQAGALVGLIVASLVVPWLWCLRSQPEVAAYALAPATLWDAAWPLLGAVVVALAYRRWGPPLLGVPPGDVVVLVERLARAVPVAPVSGPRRRGRALAARLGDLRRHGLVLAERHGSSFTLGGVALLLWGLILTWALS